MQTNSLFIPNQRGYIIRSEAFELLPGYTETFITTNRSKLDDYILAKHPAPEDPFVANTQSQLTRAVEVFRELESLKGHTLRVFEHNFFTQADIYRKTLKDLGFQHIEEIYTLMVHLENEMAILKKMNHLFSESKFGSVTRFSRSNNTRNRQRRSAASECSNQMDRFRTPVRTRKLDDTTANLEPTSTWGNCNCSKISLSNISTIRSTYGLFQTIIIQRSTPTTICA
jgi:hypothetical protein